MHEETHVEPKWLGPFEGNNLTFEECEVLTAQNISRPLLKVESELFLKKWFDYRRLHPMLATFYFFDCYEKGYKQFWRVAVDAPTAEHVSSIKRVQYGERVCTKGKRKGQMIEDKTIILRRDLTFLDGREKISFWKLRQAVDRLGIRYDFFMDRVVKWYVEECFRSECLLPPRPQHILANEDLFVKVMLAWEEECAARLQIPKDVDYSNNKFAGHAQHIAFEQFIIGQIKNRVNPKFALYAAICQHNVVRFESAVAHFDDCDINYVADMRDSPD